MKVALNQKFETPYERIKIVRYAKDGNTVITKKVKAQNIGSNFYATEPRDGGYGQWKLRDIYIYYPSASIGLYIECADESRVVNLPDFIDTPEGLIAHIDELLKNDQHIRLSLIEVVKYIAPERVAMYVKAREFRNHRLEEEREKRRAEQQESYRKEIEETNLKAFNQENECIRIFKENGDIRNDTITTAKAEEDGYPKTTSTSIILYLLRKYDIHVPLKTQGWINNSLHTVTIKDGSVTRIAYNRKSVVSNKAIECIEMLSQAIQVKEKSGDTNG